jgi:hypothetical protein
LTDHNLCNAKSAYTALFARYFEVHPDTRKQVCPGKNFPAVAFSGIAGYIF